MDARQHTSKPGTCYIQCVCNTVITFKSICKFALSLVGVWKNLSKYVCLDVCVAAVHVHRRINEQTHLIN